MNKYFKEPFPAISHLVGLVLSIVGLITLLNASGNNENVYLVSAIYGTSLILLYLASALTHGVHCTSPTEELFEKFDYAAIFLLIAGTYTPICFLMIKGTLSWIMLTTEWVLAITGIVTVFYGGLRSKASHVIIYLMMGWLFLVAIEPILTNVSWVFLSWLFAGALFYSIGAIIFIIDSQSKWKGPINGHNLWHLMVLGGSACHFIVINHFVLVTVK